MLEIDEYLIKNNIFNKVNGQVIGLRGLILKPDSIYDRVCPDCDHYYDDPDGPCQSKNGKKNFPDEKIKYKINNYGYRSSNFDTDTANNFLYSGCSYTFGTGIPYNGTWAYQLNNSFNKNKFFNLGINGASTKLIINDIYAFIRQFGHPKAIFILFPSISRFLDFRNLDGEGTKIRVTQFLDNNGNELDIFQKQITSVINFNFLFYDFINSIMALEDYCKNLNIPILWSTTDHPTNNELKKIKNIKGFFSLFDIIDPEEIINPNFKIPEKLNNKYWQNARDFHPSIQMQYIYFKAFEKAIKTKNINI